jgi:hypothetical protein
MRLRVSVVIVSAAILLGVASCEKIQQNSVSNLMDAIPLEYGDCIGVSVNGPWQTLWFQRADKSIVVVGVDSRTWRPSSKVVVIPRR